MHPMTYFETFFSDSHRFEKENQKLNNLEFENLPPTSFQLTAEFRPRLIMLLYAISKKGIKKPPQFRDGLVLEVVFVQKFSLTHYKKTNYFF